MKLNKYGCVVFKNNAEFYKVWGGGISYPGQIAKRICDHYAEQESLKRQQEQPEAKRTVSEA